MNSEHFIKYIQNPSIIDSVALTEIEKLLEQYPYFQTAHIAFILGLKQNKSIRFNEQLKIAATYVGNREKLFELLYANNESIFAETIQPNDTIAVVEETQKPEESVFEKEQIDTTQIESESNPTTESIDTPYIVEPIFETTESDLEILELH